MTIHSLDDVANFSSRYAGLIEFGNHLFQVVISTFISGKQGWTKVSITISRNAQLNSPIFGFKFPCIGSVTTIPRIIAYFIVRFIP